MSEMVLKRKAIEMSNSTAVYLRAQKQELQQAADSPLGLAVAFALGTLTSFFPIPVLDSLLAVGLAIRFARLNKAAIFLARLVWNDLLVVPLYAPGLKIGRWVLTAVLGTAEPQAALHSNFFWLLSFLVGAVILAGFAAFLGFLFILLFAKTVQARKRKQ
jgi:uncharacterized protein (DUF2062 family)